AGDRGAGLDRDPRAPAPAQPLDFFAAGNEVQQEGLKGRESKRRGSKPKKRTFGDDANSGDSRRVVAGPECGDGAAGPAQGYPGPDEGQRQERRSARGDGQG